MKEYPESLIRYSDFPKVPKKLPRPLEPDLDREIQSRLGLSNHSYDLGLLIMRNTGMRIGELANMSFDCIHQDTRGRNFLKVPLGKLYNERFVPVDTPTVALIKALQEITQSRHPRATPSHLLSRRRGERVSERLLRARFHKITRNLAGSSSDRLHPHRFRHSYASELISAGMSLTGVMQLLGHRSPNMTLRYALVSQTTTLEEFDAAQKKLKGRYQVLPLIEKSGALSTAPLTDPIEALNQAGRLLAREQKAPADARQTQKLHRLLERIRKLQTAIQEAR